MGRRRCGGRFCECLPCFHRGKFTLPRDTPLQPLPRPVEADAVDGLPYTEATAKEEDILIVREIDPCTDYNGTLHHTARFEAMSRKIEPQLVIRRGQEFRLDITLSRPYKDTTDGISFIFTVEDEEKASSGHGTLVAVPLLRKFDRHLPWNATLEKTLENTLTVKISPAPDAIVAKWRMEIDTRIIDGGAYSYSWDTGIYILFNPWCRQDQVYMHSEIWREETVLNDSGIIWRGTANRMKPVVWMYDQFEKDVLECSLYVIREIGKIKGNSRADPVKISRALAASVNSADDAGVVMGNWSEDHSGGTAPIKWLGSKEILQKYYRKKKPVKYGQCWVFSGVLTTIARAIGLPARTVTNYSSAHDTQNSLTVDYFTDDQGRAVEDLNSDSVWNFHVWNEVWMQRPDLGRDYGGWQAVDATPQEMSENMYREGPASVFAVKQGEVLRPYDCGFLYAEVNADKVFWKYSGATQPLKLLRNDIFGIGKQISTKAPGRMEREDITSSYKYPEKTTEERSTMLKALRQSENLFSRYYLNEDFNDIYFNFELKDDIKIGQPFDVILSMQNRSKTRDYSVKIILRVEVVTYTGKVEGDVKNEKYEVRIKANAIYDVKLSVTYEEYAKRLVDQSSFNIVCLASVLDTQYEYFAQDDFRVRKPDIKIQVQGTPVVGREVLADIFVENPLPVPYRKGEFTIEGAGIAKKLRVKVRSAVPPGEKARGVFKFTPTKPGRQTIAAKFVSKEIDDVDGFLVITVLPSNNTDNGIN